jgi:uncharacterized membrane protein YebE (DUF533 family)
MEFEQAVLDWCQDGSYMEYEGWARGRSFPVMRETEWRAKCIAAAILAAAETDGTLDQAREAALTALRGVGSVRAGS